MPRKRPSRFPIPTAILIALPVAAAVFFSWKFLRGKDAAYEGVPTLEVGDYYENANSLRGNTYQFTGTVEDNLRWVGGKGRVISVAVKRSDGSPGDPLPVRIPPDITDNIQNGQSFVFKVSVGEGGVLDAEAMRKN
jgi:hypothetical protein